MNNEKQPPPKSLSFSGGIHPEYDGKELSSACAISQVPLLDKYIIPISQNVGKPPKIVVKKGDTVKKGDILAEADGFVSTPLHAPTSGTVTEIGEVIGTMGVMVPAITLTPDGEDAWSEKLPTPLAWKTADAKELKQRIADAGIVGMGGAAFPCHVKLSPPPEKQIDYLILNGAECEPYLTADHRLMLEQPEKILIGIAIMGKILNVKEMYIGIEDNKFDAINSLLNCQKELGVKIVPLKVQYPQGSEKQLIYAITKRQVPSGGLPMDAGCVVQNIATAAAVYDAVVLGQPLIERVTTVTGKIVKNPCNFLVKIGTPVSKLIELANGVTQEPKKLIMGGPMMGFAQKSFDVPICKNSSGVLLLGKQDVSLYESAGCIRCGACYKGCPMHLSAGPMSVAIEAERFDLAEQNHVMDCLECGACAYVCPASRPLVQHLRRAKAQIRKNAQK